MSDNITLKKAEGTYSIRAAGAVLGETTNAIELNEKGLDPVIYIPRADLAMAFFDKTEHSTTCPHKGEATYYTIQAKSGPIKNAAWSYEAPIKGMEAITGHLAFYGDKVTVEAI